MTRPVEQRVVALPPKGLVRGWRVGVAAGGASWPAGPALLSAETADGMHLRAVEVHRLDEVPAGVLAVGEDLHDELGLLEDVRWNLRPQPVVDVERIVLELPTERPPETAAEQIARAGLVGTPLWVPAQPGELSLDVAGVPHRVIEIDTGSRCDVVARIGPRTTVELFAPGVKAGVDMVILADCSGSMAAEDIPVPRESMLALRRKGYIKRMEALQQALQDLLEVRLRLAGRVSRVALMSFTSTTTPRFPRGGGMAQLDGGSPPEVVQQFREAVALLQPGGYTHIGNAIHAAADLLYQHGHPGNERLVVLVSDGADWAPRGESGTGEITEAISEPVGLMEHLHRDMNIRLHAIGISTRDLFLRRYRTDQPGITPNHDLLEALVKVGGGDPTTIGGLDVLVEYFSGVGSGITHRVRQTLSAAPRESLDPGARDVLRRSAGSGSWAGDRNAALEAFGIVITQVETVSDRVFPGRLIPSDNSGRAQHRLGSEASEDQLGNHLGGVVKLLYPTLPREFVRPPAVTGYVALLDQLKARIEARPTDLNGLAAICRPDGAGPGALVVAVIRRLTEALSAVAAEAAGLPDYMPSPARTPMRPAQRAPETEQGPSSTGSVVPGFVMKD
ncbi:MAG: vWA domain-containing protein [Actinomycetota bacterium]|nr:vWA domain-containing protein [Actinomycetota bacterium]